METQTQQAPEDLVDPFDGDSKTFEVTSEINVEQVQREISERLGRQVRVALTIGLGEIASKDKPGVLFVSPADIDGRTVRGVVESHKPRKVLPPTPAHPANGPLVPNTPDVAAAREKLAEGGRLTSTEVSNLFRDILGVDPTQG